MECPRCGGNMSSGVCEDCGFPEIGKIRYQMMGKKQQQMIKILSRLCYYRH